LCRETQRHCLNTRNHSPFCNFGSKRLLFWQHSKVSNTIVLRPVASVNLGRESEDTWQLKRSCENIDGFHSVQFDRKTPITCFQFRKATFLAMDRGTLSNSYSSILLALPVHSCAWKRPKNRTDLSPFYTVLIIWFWFDYFDCYLLFFVLFFEVIDRSTGMFVSDVVLGLRHGQTSARSAL